MAKVGARTWRAVVREAVDGLPVVTSTGEALARDGVALTSTDLARLLASRVRLVVMRRGVPNAIDDVQGLTDCLIVRLVPISVLSERSPVSSRPPDAVRSPDGMTP
jgi:hypothetical protein